MVLETEGNFQGASKVAEVFFLIVNEFSNSLYHQFCSAKAESTGAMFFVNKIYFQIMLGLLTFDVLTATILLAFNMSATCPHSKLTRTVPSREEGQFPR